MSLVLLVAGVLSGLALHAHDCTLHWGAAIRAGALGVSVHPEFALRGVGFGCARGSAATWRARSRAAPCSTFPVELVLPSHSEPVVDALARVLQS